MARGGVGGNVRMLVCLMSTRHDIKNTCHIVFKHISHTHVQCWCVWCQHDKTSKTHVTYPSNTYHIHTCNDGVSGVIMVRMGRSSCRLGMWYVFEGFVICV